MICLFIHSLTIKCQCYVRSLGSIRPKKKSLLSWKLNSGRLKTDSKKEVSYIITRKWWALQLKKEKVWSWGCQEWQGGGMSFYFHTQALDLTHFSWKYSQVWPRQPMYLYLCLSSAACEGRAATQTKKF